MTIIAAFQVGDHIELSVSNQSLQQGLLPLEPALGGFFGQSDVAVVMDNGPEPIRPRYDAATSALKSAQLRRLAKQPGSLRLECVAAQPYRFSLAVEPLPPAAVPAAQSVGPIELAAADLALLRHDPRAPARWSDFRLSLQAARLGMVAGFDQLLCLPWLREVELLEHQVRTARTVLRRLRGRALLCDEVGLGKTVEAGIIMLELIVRGLARRVLILTPPSLVEQWQGEMRRKFGQDFIAYDDVLFREQGTAAWGAHERIVASYHTAKRAPHREAILSQHWDLVIIDEAHHFRNRRTLLWQLAAELTRQYVLLLTATPVQNDLEELFNLVTLLQPGLLSTARTFQQQFVDRRDKLMPRNVEQMHQLLDEVMVRNRRSTVGLALTRRIARTQLVSLSDAERALYGSVSQFVRRHLRGGAEAESAVHPSPLSRMSLVTLQKEVGSAGQAAAPALSHLAQDERLPPAERRTLQELAGAAQGLRVNAKSDALLALLADFPDKTVVFTQFRATQAWLEQRLRERGEQVVVFHGGLRRLEKEEAIRRFQGEVRILLSTDAGSEGRNLQFCHAICNFDLPWNPMKIEQRIGRLSRIGQQNDVLVFNLAARDTLEAAILHLLEAKIAMFELVIGEIDMILGNLDENKEFEDVVADLWAQSTDTADFRGALDRLGEQLLAAKEVYLRQRARGPVIWRTICAGGVVVACTADRPSRARRSRFSLTMPDPLESFLLDYVDAAGGLADEIEPQVYDVLLPDSDKPQRIAFDPDALPEYPSAQLLSFGSALLDDWLAQAQTRGRVASAYLDDLHLHPHGLEQRVQRDLTLPAAVALEIQAVRPLYVSHALFWFEATFVHHEKEQVLHSVCFDRYYARPVRYLQALIGDGRLSDIRRWAYPDAPARSLDQVYLAGRESVLRTVSAEVNVRQKELRTGLAVQAERTHRYYADMRAELRERIEKSDARGAETESLRLRMSALDREEALRLEESQRKAVLRVQLALRNLLYVKIPRLFLSARVLPRGEKRSVASRLQALTISWDPLSEKTDALDCPQCGHPTFELRLNSAGTLVCPQCESAPAGR